MPFQVSQVHSAPGDTLEELAASYALGSLDPDEHGDFTLHIEVCDVCRDLVAEYWTTSSMLDEAQEEREGSDALRERLVLSTYEPVEVTASDLETPTPHQTPAPVTGAGRRWYSSSTALVSVAAAILLIAAAALIAWNLSLQDRLSNRDQEADRWQEMARVIATGAQQIDLVGTDNAPEASASLFKDPNSDTAFIVFQGLPLTAGDDVFQLWVITGETPRSAGLIDPGEVTDSPVMVQIQLENADAVGVSTEPSGGSEQPTGPIVLLGDAT